MEEKPMIIWVKRFLKRAINTLYGEWRTNTLLWCAMCKGKSKWRIFCWYSRWVLKKSSFFIQTDRIPLLFRSSQIHFFASSHKNWEMWFYDGDRLGKTRKKPSDPFWNPNDYRLPVTSFRVPWELSHTRHSMLMQKLSIFQKGQ